MVVAGPLITASATIRSGERIGRRKKAENCDSHQKKTFHENAPSTGLLRERLYFRAGVLAALAVMTGQEKVSIRTSPR
jgi:hypothetical protein